MFIGSTGDLAQSYSMQSRNAALKQDIQRLTLEISSGKLADVRQAVGGNTAYINDLERSLTKLDGFGLAAREAGQFAGGVQTVLSQIGALGTSFRNTLLTSSNSALGETSTRILSEANETFTSVVNAMNTSVGGRTILGGTATDSAPLAPPADILAALTTAVTGAGSVDDILAAADSWFNDPAGFSSIGYQGSTSSLAPIALSDDDNATFDLRADDPVFRDTLRNLAVVAIASDPGLGLTQTQQNELFQKVTDPILGAEEGLIQLQAKVGFSESRVEAIKVRQESERTSLELARSDLLSADPFQTATELEQVQFQLQSLYAITSRMSQLSLVNYL
ncbi:flagellin [uncultured Sulfitobacter sp.]|uniref:flagellin n=1 Tax=uncultured Sulfitobacter sp. TaxID=191468 RepID=UPI00263953BB|nr:flagellin [uncultured Sulfitobacter sp.]